LCPALLAQSYSYYYTDNFTSLNTSNWYTNGPVSASSTGLTVTTGVGGSTVSKVVVPDGTSDYEATMTVHLPAGMYGWNTSYSLMARASSDAMVGSPASTGISPSGSFYAFSMSSPSWDGTSGNATFILMKKVPNAGLTTITSFPFACHDGMTMTLIVKGSSITMGIDSAWWYTITDSDITSGMAGVSLVPAAGTRISSVQLGAIDRVAPNAVASGSLKTSASPLAVDLQWAAATDNAGGSGVIGYQISRDGVYLGATISLAYTDETVTTTSGTTYSIVAYDRHGNTSTATTTTVAVPSSPVDARRTGVRPTGAYWGAAGEQIDVMSGNLNFALPVGAPKSRGGWGATFMLSYNSQMWRQDSSGSWLLGRDVGFGLGWRLQAGSIFPVIYNGSLMYLIFTDATGAEYRLYDDSNWIFRSREGLHLWMDWGAATLWFPDGGHWYMYAQSSGLEADAGTLYPTSMNDGNGNWMQITYQTGNGSVSSNTSARITGVAAAADGCNFSYGGSGIPHLTSFTCGQNSYTMNYSSASLADPFAGGSFGTATLLSGLTNNGLNTAHQFAYNSSAEMTQLTTPLGGVMGWSYRTYTYSATNRGFREVLSRTAVIQGTTNTWNMSTDTGATQHATWTVSDTGANSSKVWSIGTSGAAAGAVTSYEERGPGSVALIHKDYTWTTDSGNNVYVGTVLTTEKPGASQVQTMSTQTLDTYGNITQSAVYDYGNLTTPAKTYNFTYLTDSNYTSRYIRNRVTQVTVTPAGGSANTLVTNTYDAYTPSYGCAPLTARNNAGLHDDGNYGTGFTYRGNVTNRSSLGGSVCVAFETTGVAVQTTDGAGRVTSAAPSADSSYSLPGVLTPGGNSNLATTVTYASSWQVTSVTGPNGAQGNTTYDGNGRPQKTVIPDGAETDYTYTYAGAGGATANTQTATIGTGASARFKKTTLDGFGRVTRVETGYGTTTVSQVDTQYAPCACSPLGKLWRVSQPYAPGGNPVWTTYAYDGSGRTVSVTAPDGSVTTTEYLTTYSSYSGSLVRVTDPAGKWKIQQTDGMGNLIRVIEPDASGQSTLITNYTYNAVGQMTQVSMPRSNGTQTRTFVYTGTDLTSATNPENGTATYLYDGAHHVTQRTDAKGQQTRYVYDTIGRLTQVQHWAGSPLAEIAGQHVDYYYDSNPLNGTYSQNVWGRLAA
jgi:YD repeat-containing protein